MTHSKHRVSLTAHVIMAICLVFAAAIARPPSAWSGGFMLYEQGTPDVGLASAGQGAGQRHRRVAPIGTLDAGLGVGTKGVIAKEWFSPDEQWEFLLCL